MENIFHTTGRYRYLLSMTYRVGFWVGTVKKPHCTKFQNHSFVDVRLNAEYLKEGERHNGYFKADAPLHVFPFTLPPLPLLLRLKRRPINTGKKFLSVNFPNKVTGRPSSLLYDHLVLL